MIALIRKHLIMILIPLSKDNFNKNGTNLVFLFELFRQRTRSLISKNSKLNKKKKEGGNVRCKKMEEKKKTT